MALEIYYTPQSRETLKGIYNFIHNKFGFSSAEKLSLKAEKTISLIALQPLMFRASNIDEKVRIALISKQTSFFIGLPKIQYTFYFFGIIDRSPFYLNNKPRLYLQISVIA